MKALQFDTKGDLSSLALRDVPDAVTADGQVLVQVRAAGINPSDVKNVLGIFPYTTVPRIAGRDFAGVVVAGPVEWLGKEVFGCASENGFHQDGSHAELLAVTPSALVEKPEQLSFVQAAALGVPYVTAWEAIKRARLVAGERILILGAGAVAKAAAQLLRWQGHEAVMALRNAEQLAQLQASGQACVALTAPEQLPDQVQAHFGALADFIFDTTGQLLAPAVYSLARFGRLAVIAAPKGGMAELPLLPLYRRGGVLIGVNSLLHDNQACNDLLRELLPGFVSGALVPDTPATCPLTDGVAAYHAIHQGGVTKLVLLP